MQTIGAKFKAFTPDPRDVIAEFPVSAVAIRAACLACARARLQALRRGSRTRSRPVRRANGQRLSSPARAARSHPVLARLPPRSVGCSFRFPQTRFRASMRTSIASRIAPAGNAASTTARHGDVRAAAAHLIAVRSAAMVAPGRSDEPHECGENDATGCYRYPVHPRTSNRHHIFQLTPWD